MTENQNPENITDDVEDTEAHGFRGKALLSEEPTGEHVEDVEGHGFRGNRIESDDDGDDVEGHATRVKF